MKHIKKRRIFLKKISYLFFAFIGFFTIKKFDDKNDYLSIFINKINLLDPQKKNITKILDKYNYSHYQKFISDYRASNFNSFNEVLFNEKRNYWWYNPSDLLRWLGDINYEIGNNEKAIEYLYASIETIQILNEIAEEKINSENLEDFTTEYWGSYYFLAIILFDTDGNASELNRIGNYLESVKPYNANWFLIRRLIFNNRLNK